MFARGELNLDHAHGTEEGQPADAHTAHTGVELLFDRRDVALDKSAGAKLRRYDHRARSDPHAKEDRTDAGRHRNPIHR